MSGVDPTKPLNLADTGGTQQHSSLTPPPPAAAKGQIVSQEILSKMTHFNTEERKFAQEALDKIRKQNPGKAVECPTGLVVHDSKKKVLEFLYAEGVIADFGITGFGKPVVKVQASDQFDSPLSWIKEAEGILAETQPLKSKLQLLEANLKQLDADKQKLEGLLKNKPVDVRNARSTADSAKALNVKAAAAKSTAAIIHKDAADKHAEMAKSSKEKVKAIEQLLNDATAKKSKADQLALEAEALLQNAAQALKLAETEANESNFLLFYNQLIKASQEISKDAPHAKQALDKIAAQPAAGLTIIKELEGYLTSAQGRYAGYEQMFQSISNLPKIPGGEDRLQACKKELDNAHTIVLDYCDKLKAAKELATTLTLTKALSATTPTTTISAAASTSTSNTTTPKPFRPPLEVDWSKGNFTLDEKLYANTVYQDIDKAIDIKQAFACPQLENLLPLDSRKKVMDFFLSQNLIEAWAYGWSSIPCVKVKMEDPLPKPFTHNLSTPGGGVRHLNPTTWFTRNGIVEIPLQT